MEIKLKTIRWTKRLSYDLCIRFPRAWWWGMVTIIMMLAIIIEHLQVGESRFGIVILIVLTIFIFGEFFRLRKCWHDDEEDEEKETKVN